MYTHISTGTIKNKDTKKREAFLIIGDYDSKAAFNEALDRQFDRDSYDFRTVRFADQVYTDLSKQVLISLDYLQEDLDL